MFAIEVIGNNSVGKMYRPKKIVDSGKRGYIVNTRYKSNYGGTPIDMILEMNLVSNLKNRTEVLSLSVSSPSGIKCAVDKNSYKGVNKKKARSCNDDVFISSVRKIIKPDSYFLMKKDIPIVIRCEDGIVFLDVFIDSDIEEEKELINLAIYPSIIKDEECLVIHSNSKTPVLIENEKGVKLV